MQIQSLRPSRSLDQGLSELESSAEPTAPLPLASQRAGGATTPPLASPNAQRVAPRSRPLPPPFAQHEVEGLLRTWRSQNVALAASGDANKLLTVHAHVRAAFDSAYPPNALIARDEALQVFARYRLWALGLGMTPAQLSHWDIWIAGYAATSGCTPDALRDVGDALLQRRHGRAQWLMQDNAVEALARGQSDEFPRSFLAERAALVGDIDILVVNTLALRLQASLHVPNAAPLWSDYLWSTLKSLPAAALPVLLPYIARQPGFSLTTARAHTVLRPKPGTHDAWLRAVVQLSPKHQAALLTGVCGAQILAHASPAAVLAQIATDPVWRAFYWRTDVAQQTLTADQITQLRGLLPKAIGRTMLQVDRPLARFFPELHWQFTARTYLIHKHVEIPDEAASKRLVLDACIQGTDIPPGMATTPALQLVVDPQAWVDGGDWSALDLPALSHVLQKETPQIDADARHGQHNRLRALGRYVHVCRDVGLDPNQEPHAELVQSLLRLPNQAARHALLHMHVRKTVDEDGEHWLDIVRGIFAQHPSEHARALALALVALHSLNVGTPALGAILRSRAVAHQGETAARLLHVVVHGYTEGTTRWLDFVTNLFEWLNVARLFDLAAWSMAQEDLVALANGGDDPALLQGIARSENASTVGAALLQQCSRQQLPDCAQAYVRGERLRLSRMATWMQGQDDLKAVGANLLAYLDAPMETRRWRDALAGAQALPRGARRNLAEALCQQAKRIHVLGRKGASHGPDLTDEFFTQSAVRQFINWRVMPMLLRMQEHSAALVRQRAELHTLRTPDDVLQYCLGFLPKETALADWETLTQRVPQAEYLATYWQSAAYWAPRWGDARGAFKALVQAVLNGSEHALRRTSAQMRKVLAHPQGAGILPVWEPDHQETQTVNGIDYTLEDTANFGKMLMATTEIGSCQSVHDNLGYNVGMLGRMQCGSKRMVTLRDAQGKLRARAAMRLLVDDKGVPALTLGRAYGANAPGAYQRMLNAYLVRRAAGMGIATVAGHGASGNAVMLTSQRAAMPDYYDGAGGLALAYSMYVHRLSPCDL